MSCMCNDCINWTYNDSDDETSSYSSDEDQESEHSVVSDTEDDSMKTDTDFDDILDSSAHDPLYPGAPLSLVESVVSILSLLLSFQITGVLLTKILELIELHCIKPNKCHKTLYKFKKFFRDLKTPLIRHFFCSGCFSKLEKKNSVCQICKCNKNVSYFIEIPIIAQLRALFKRPGFYDKIANYRFNRKKKNVDNLEDIYDGLIYKKLVSEGFLSCKSNVSFTWNTDGVPLFKSSKFSIWPFFLSINELPYDDRIKKENVVLAGIWFGLHKPVPNLFMGVFRDSLKKLFKGVDFKINKKETVKCRGMIICGTCDLCAKSLFLNMKQYNGWYGCQKCRIRGERIGNVQVYPYCNEINLRTSPETIQFAKEAKTRKKDVFGVKGPTVLSEIVYDFITTTAIDIMHCIYINVTKRLLSIWFDTEYSSHPASLRPFLLNINKAINSIRPIDSIVRRPRSLDDLAHWKATELREFLLVYSLPILRDYMQNIYFEHHILLVLGITILNSTSISEQMLVKAESTLTEYVKRFEILYGKNHMTSNIHLILHLSDTVKQFGPLFTTSCFSFENFNGILKNFVHGSKNPELQIHASVSILLNMTELKNIILCKNSSAAKFCTKTEQRTKYRRKLRFISNKIFVVGTYYKEKNDHEVRNTLNFNVINSNTKLHYFKRLFKDNIMYETEAYSSNKMLNSTCLKYVRNSSEKIGIVKYFVRVCACNCESDYACNNCKNECKTFAIVKQCKKHHAFFDGLNNPVPTIYICDVKIPEILVAVEINNIECSCFKIKYNDYFYAIEPANFIAEV